MLKTKDVKRVGFSDQNSNEKKGNGEHAHASRKGNGFLRQEVSSRANTDNNNCSVGKIEGLA